MIIGKYWCRDRCARLSRCPTVLRQKRRHIKHKCINVRTKQHRVSWWIGWSSRPFISYIKVCTGMDVNLHAFPSLVLMWQASHSVRHTHWEKIQLPTLTVGQWHVSPSLDLFLVSKNTWKHFSLKFHICIIRIQTETLSDTLYIHIPAPVIKPTYPVTYRTVDIAQYSAPLFSHPHEETLHILKFSTTDAGNLLTSWHLHKSHWINIMNNSFWTSAIPTSKFCDVT